MFSQFHHPQWIKKVMEQFISWSSYCRKLVYFVFCSISSLSLSIFSFSSSKLFLSCFWPFSSMFHWLLTCCHQNISAVFNLRCYQSFLLLRFHFFFFSCKGKHRTSHTKVTVCVFSLLNEIGNCCWKFWMSSRKSGFNTAMLIFFFLFA